MSIGGIIFGVTAVVLLIIGLANEKKTEGKVALILSVLSVFATIYYSRYDGNNSPTSGGVIVIGNDNYFGTTTIGSFDDKSIDTMMTNADANANANANADADADANADANANADTNANADANADTDKSIFSSSYSKCSRS